MKETFVFFFSLISLAVEGQAHVDTLLCRYKIIGKVLNGKNQQPIGFATVSLLRKDSTIIKSLLTGIDGTFKFDDIAIGNSFLNVSFIGFSKVIMRPLSGSKHNNLLNVGEIILHGDSHQLNEVIISSHTPMLEQKTDRLVFNMAHALTAVGGDALDALKITPGVSIQDNQIGLIGKSSVIVMIDDRKIQLSGEDLISFLSTLKTADIKSIEVITNPPARYDAEGNSGILNITLKKTKINSWNASLQSAYTQNTYTSGTAGASIAYNRDKLSFFLNVNYINSSKNRTESDRIYYPDQFWNTDFKKRSYLKALGLQTGLDYQLSRSWSIGFLYLGGFNRPTIDENDRGTITNNASEHLDSLINTMAQSIRHTSSNSLNWHSDLKLDTLGKLLSLNFDYFNFDGNINRNFNTETRYPDQQLTPGGRLSTDNLGKQDVSNYSFKADIDLPAHWAKISLGCRISYTQTNSYINYINTSSSGISSIDDQSDRFKYNVTSPH